MKKSCYLARFIGPFQLSVSSWIFNAIFGTLSLKKLIVKIFSPWPEKALKMYPNTRFSSHASCASTWQADNRPEGEIRLIDFEQTSPVYCISFTPWN